jgi:hypothetical protein
MNWELKLLIKFEAGVMLSLIFDMNEKIKKELNTAIPYLIPLFTFFIGIYFSLVILPENCHLYGNPDGPFMCDAIPNNCCKDMMAVTYAQIIFWLGIGLSVAPFLILWKKESQEQSDNELKIVE